MLDVHDEKLTDADMEGLTNTLYHGDSGDDSEASSSSAEASTSSSGASSTSFSIMKQVCDYLPAVCNAASYLGLSL